MNRFKPIARGALNDASEARAVQPADCRAPFEREFRSVPSSSGAYGTEDARDAASFRSVVRTLLHGAELLTRATAASTEWAAAVTVEVLAAKQTRPTVTTAASRKSGVAAYNVVIRGRTEPAAL